MTHDRSSDFAAFIGIDWADAQHVFTLQETGSAQVERGQVKQTPEALTEWITMLRQRFGGRPIGICVETPRGPLVHALLEHDFLRIFPVNPKSFNNFRKAFAPSGAKDDPTDADLLLELVTKHRDRLRCWMPDDAETRTLDRLTQARREAVQLRSRLSQQMRAELKSYFPQALEWAGSDLFSPLAIDFLLEWPTLEAVQRAHPETLRKFYCAHNCRRGDLIQARLEGIRTATALTTDSAIIEPAVMKVQMLARQLKALGPSIVKYEKRIAELFESHADAFLFDDLPGAGANLAPRLLAAFGSDRDRYEAAQDLQEYSGIAPVLERSGKQVWVHWRWSAPTFLRQTFHEFAWLSTKRSVWARAYYEQQRERGADHHAAIRSLAFKWIRILYRCWKKRIPYDEARYLHALQKRGSPLARRFALPAAA